MDNLLETMAANIESGADESLTRVSFGTLKENVDTVLGLVVEAARSARAVAYDEEPAESGWLGEPE